jgi:hypothetical protein
MSDERLRQLYTAALAGRPASPGASHPSPETIAALVRREGPEEDRLAVLDHVMSCAECRREFDLLRTIEGVGARTGAGTGSRRSWYVPAALAASVLLAVGIGRQALRPADDTTRGGDGGAIALVQPGTEAPAGQPLVFAWHPVRGASQYELELLDAGGGLAASASTADTSAAPEAARSLPPGEYRWWVRTTTAEAGALRSALRPLRLR